MEKENEVIDRIIKGEKELYEVIMRKYNQRLYRIARSIIKNESEIEDVLQETYIKAFIHLNQFEGRSQFSTWLTRILINQANACLLKRRKLQNSVSEDISENIKDEVSSFEAAPDQQMVNKELKKYLEDAIDHLPENLRAVYIMREVEGLSVAETSECLSISVENVKTRLHRSKAMLKEFLFAKAKGDLDVFRFGLERCDRLVMAVLYQVGKLN
jgi:RNA polymerase sigma-70 factor (ECF subfamily)